jgi:adenylyltransferase/sulfurtransferase
MNPPADNLADVDPASRRHPASDLDPTPPLDPRLARYSRQVLFDRIGAEGQRRLLESRVVLVGCGALGTVLAGTMVRAGVGFLRICDRDFIERDNLQRQVLFDEADIAAGLPKAEAAARKLARINSEVRVEPVVTDVNPGNIERLAEGCALILDGSDNFETRFLINDLAVRSGTPWIYGAVIGATGLCMPVLPGETPCLRCVFEEAPPPEMNPTCDTAGVIAPAVNVVASLQAVEAMKILMHRRDEVTRGLMHVDVWAGRFMNMNVQAALERGKCPCCRQRRFDYLDGRAAGLTTTLCGRNAVQVVPATPTKVDLAAVAGRLRGAGAEGVTHNEFMLRATLGEYELALFPDGRAIVKGTDRPERARSLIARYVGA